MSECDTMDFFSERELKQFKEDRRLLERLDSEIRKLHATLKKARGAL